MRGLRKVLARLTRPAPALGQSPADVVHREARWRLMRYQPRAEGLAYATPILLVPSLINRWYVLDLMPGRSLAEYLVGRGHDVFIVDWGRPAPEDRYTTFEDICDRAIGRALRIAARTTPRGQAHLLGYCLGGTLTAIHAAARPARVASLVELAAPVRFVEGGVLAAWMRSGAFDIDALVDGLGVIPWPLMQAAFHALRPTLIPSKLVHLVDRDWDDEGLDGFFAIERWGQDNVSLPGEFYRTYIRDLYQRDQLVRGEFRLGGRPARLEDLRCPLFTITFEHDHIVPAPSAMAVHELAQARDKTHLHLPGGHVGAVVARTAEGRLWRPLSAWWAAHEREAPAPRASRPRRHGPGRSATN